MPKYYIDIKSPYQENVGSQFAQQPQISQQSQEPASQQQFEAPSFGEMMGPVKRVVGTALADTLSIPSKLINAYDTAKGGVESSFENAFGRPMLPEYARPSEVLGELQKGVPVGENLNPPKQQPSYEELQKGDLNIRQFAPTQDQWKWGIQKLIGENIDPQSVREEDASRWLGKAMQSAGMGLGPALATIVGGEAVRGATKYFGGSEKAQDIGDLVGSLGASLMTNMKSLKNIVKDKYAYRDSLIDSSTKVSANNLRKETSEFISNLKKDAEGFPNKKAAIRKAEELIGQNIKNKSKEVIKTTKKGAKKAAKKAIVNDYEIGLQDLADFKRSVNDLASSNPEMYKLSKILNNNIAEEAGQKFPEWFATHIEADKLHGISVERTALGNLIHKNKHLAKIYDNPVVSTLLGLGTYGAHGLIASKEPLLGLGAKAAAAGGAVIGAGKIHKAVDAIFRHPEIAKMYLDTYKIGMTGNVARLAKHGNKLSSALNKTVKYYIDI